MMNDGMLFQFTCSRCGAHASVPFEPRPGSQLLCPTCLNNSKQSGVLQRKRQKPNRQLFPIICAHCGAHDHVSFKPRPDSKVLCSVCNANPDIVARVKRARHRIICDRCGDPAFVPFVPDQGSKVYCRTCLRYIKESKEERFSPKRIQQWVPPGVEHDTRIRFEIVCAECGAKDSLPFVPKTKGPLLCKACAEKRFGPGWRGSRPEDKPPDYEMTCSQCGRKDYVPFEPKPDRELLCNRCQSDQAVPNRDRVSERRPFSEYVYIQKGDRES